MPLKKFKVVVQTDPPDANTANDEARWGKLADTILRPDASRDESRPTTTRAREEHKRLMQELNDIVDRSESEYRWAA